MKRRALLLLAALLAFPFASSAQEATPTPAPINPMVYDDPGMHFQAPAGYRPVGQRRIALDDLGSGPQVVAAWISPGDRPNRLLVQIEAYGGDLEQYETSYTQTLRESYGDALVKNKERMALKNGMPAMFMEGSFGSGFDTTKLYMVIWIDGARGCALTIVAPLGALDTATAKHLLSDVSAVRYPLGRG